MKHYRDLLVAIDDFQTSEPLLRFAGELAGGRKDFRIHLFHALGPLPPQLLESRGAEDPRQEQKMESQQVEQQNNWLERARSEVDPLVEHAISRLTVAKVDADSIAIHLIELYRRDELAEEIIKAARNNDCGTIIVGYKSYPWIRESFHNHICDRLISESKRLAVCVVKG